MPSPSSAPGVALPRGESASTFLLRLLREVAQAHPGSLGSMRLPRDAKVLKKRFADVLLELEQRRAAAGERWGVARHLARATQLALRLADEDGRSRPLAELRPAAPLDIDERASAPGPGWRPSVSFAAETFEGADIEGVLGRLEARHQVGSSFAEALRRVLARLDGGGRLDLTGERFAVLGAGAEIAPTRHLLEAGATVLWCDLAPPPDDLPGAGRLLWTREPADLLCAPDRVAGTVARLAESEGPVHVGLFAYGPGKGREWRLAAAMNAVVNALPEAALRSVGLYVSPTSPAVLDAAEAERLEARLRGAAASRRALRATRLLRANRSRPGLPRVADVIVPIQGVSYQAAQWIEKTLAAEALATNRPELRVSANVAPITRTRSLSHPVFEAAFRGAPLFGVSTFDAETTRTLAGLVYIEDVLGPEPAPGPKHLHGGLFVLPDSLESAIRLAALRGLAGQADLRV